MTGDTDTPEVSGKRVVALLYVVAVALAGGYGALVGVVIRPNLDATIGALGPIMFRLSPVNLAIYGVAMVGLSLGVFFAVSALATRYEDPPRRRDEAEGTAR
ncbi:DUF7520 family protein [Halocalculus aciditolerans]|uniref:Cox cluster protein n=1 Tax=Halocalculus aciditolerans TaxID=1383812 RepID=A0A830FNT6_9EURY|nr:hypothetical protein [Halocalculus aciditolerans]GGL71597.1 hypothetical protein GCM10009039_32060 [Halocalculus aciditolerans]